MVRSAVHEYVAEASRQILESDFVLTCRLVHVFPEALVIIDCTLLADCQTGEKFVEDIVIVGVEVSAKTLGHFIGDSSDITTFLGDLSKLDASYEATNHRKDVLRQCAGLVSEYEVNLCKVINDVNVSYMDLPTLGYVACTLEQILLDAAELQVLKDLHGHIDADRDQMAIIDHDAQVTLDNCLDVSVDVFFVTGKVLQVN